MKYHLIDLNICKRKLFKQPSVYMQETLTSLRDSSHALLHEGD